MDTLVLVAVVAVTSLAVLITVVDRYLAAEAERRASAYLSKPFNADQLLANLDHV